jgi:hypothetical protein
MMMRNTFVACLVALTGFSCAEDLPVLVNLTPAQGTVDVSVAARVQAEISREDAQVGDGEECRMSASTTTFEVVDALGQKTEGSTVFFLDGLKAQFTPSGMFSFGQGYTATVNVACSAEASASFTVVQTSDSVVPVAEGDSMRIVELSVSEPGPIKNLLEEFLAEADLLMQVLELGDDQIRMTGGEGKTASDASEVGDINLRLFAPNAFLFPMVGVYKAPYFQVEGTLKIPVGELDAEIVLERFELSGRFVNSGTQDLPQIEIVDSSIRASSSCADVCAVDEKDLQLVCANPSTFCDDNNVLNLIGAYGGAPNALAAYQTITVSTQESSAGAGDGLSLTSTAVEVPVNASFVIGLTKEINIEKAGAVAVILTPKGSEQAVDGNVTISSTGLSATYTPTSPLDAATTYTMLVVAHRAHEVSFNTP